MVFPPPAGVLGLDIASAVMGQLNRKVVKPICVNTSYRASHKVSLTACRGFMLSHQRLIEQAFKCTLYLSKPS